MPKCPMLLGMSKHAIHIYPILEQLAYKHVGQLLDNQGLKLFDSQVGPQTLLLSWHSKP